LIGKKESPSPSQSSGGLGFDGVREEGGSKRRGVGKMARGVMQRELRRKEGGVEEDEGEKRSITTPKLAPKTATHCHAQVERTSRSSTMEG
jgi:hypothetical protein